MAVSASRSGEMLLGDSLSKFPHQGESEWRWLFSLFGWDNRECGCLVWVPVPYPAFVYLARKLDRLFCFFLFLSALLLLSYIDTDFYLFFLSTTLKLKCSPLRRFAKMEARTACSRRVICIIVVIISSNDPTNRVDLPNQ